MAFSKKIDLLISDLQKVKITPQRASELQNLAQLILKMKQSSDLVNLNFICTHNSRRSQIAELTMRMACSQYGINYVQTFSGGTEATALNYRVALALEALGFVVNKATDDDNPIYSISFEEESADEPAMFSKVFDHESSPTSDLIAVMVCSDAEENCPFIPGADHRFPLSYKDPKHSDDTEEESHVYQEKVKEIGLEMMYLGKMLELKTQ